MDNKQPEEIPNMVFYEGDEPISHRTALNPHMSMVDRMDSPMNNLGSVGPTSLNS